jgi:hypothetical protein
VQGAAAWYLRYGESGRVDFIFTSPFQPIFNRILYIDTEIVKKSLRKEGKTLGHRWPLVHEDVRANHSSALCDDYSSHCKENPIYVFLFWELSGLTKFQILVSVSDLFIPRIGPHIWLQKNRQTGPVYKSLTDI